MSFLKYLITITFILAALASSGQLQWQNVDSLYQPLPSSVHIFFTEQKIDTSPFRAFYLIADLKDKKLAFTTDTTSNRRFTPSQFYEKNQRPLVVVNGTFFSFETNRNLNVVIKAKNVLSYNATFTKSKKDSTVKLPVYSSAIGINKRRRADVAWVHTDSSWKHAKAVQFPYTAEGNFFIQRRGAQTGKENFEPRHYNPFTKWKMETAIGGGPVLLQNGQIRITNNEERKFVGKAINDKHPRTAIGYTADRKLIILVIEGRNPNASGATLIQEAEILKSLECVEAINLDGGGSSCLLVNGKDTIKPSDKNGQRPVPAVFIIQGNK